MFDRFEGTKRYNDKIKPKIVTNIFKLNFGMKKGIS